MGTMPPISFLLQNDDGEHVKARFHPAEMRWELVEDDDGSI